MAEIEMKDGGPAFPRSLPGIPGMTLRDYLAGQIVAGGQRQMFLDADGRVDADLAAKRAYAMADAMIRARGEATP